MGSRTPRSEVLAAWLAGQRWFGSKTQAIGRVDVEDTVPLGGAVIAVVTAHLGDGSADRYLIPLRQGDAPEDALADPAFARALLAVVADEARVAGERGAVVGRRTRAFPRDLPAPLAVRRLAGEQSNVSVVLGDALILKQFRRLRAGINPEQEITRFLTERTTYAHTPRLAGHLEYRTDAATATLAVVQEHVAGARDGWQWTLERLHEYVAAARAEGAPPTAARVRALAAPLLVGLGRLGQRTGQLHVALASDPRDPDFAPEPITGTDLAAWADGIRRQVEAARAALGGRLPAEVGDVAGALAGLRGVARIRHHGDFHLGQTLRVDDRADFAIIDFEGEPLRPLEERRRKHAAVRDVAGMRRSIDYAAASAGAPDVAPWLALWRAEAAREFTDRYREATRGAAFVPPSEADFARALAAFELEKAAYEIVYEANNRPDWLAIPTQGFVSAAASLRAAGSAGGA
jgi:predicted trehalose synthase